MLFCQDEASLATQEDCWTDVTGGSTGVRALMLRGLTAAWGAMQATRAEAGGCLRRACYVLWRRGRLCAGAARVLGAIGRNVLPLLGASREDRSRVSSREHGSVA